MNTFILRFLPNGVSMKYFIDTIYTIGFEVLKKLINKIVGTFKNFYLNLFYVTYTTMES